MNNIHIIVMLLHLNILKNVYDIKFYFIFENKMNIIKLINSFTALLHSQFKKCFVTLLHSNC